MHQDKLPRIVTSYSINQDTFDRFDKLCKKKNLNRSRVVEELIRSFLDKELSKEKSTDDIVTEKPA